MAPTQRLLAVGFKTGEFTRLESCFDRSWDVDRFPGGRGALDLLRPRAVDMVLVKHPLPDLTLADFLKGLREPTAQSRHAALVVITERDKAGEAVRFIGKGANRVLTDERAPELLGATTRALLRVAPRSPATLPARLEMPHLGSFLGVVRNSSATGLLIETGQRPPKGTELGFELTLPENPEPIQGRARVVRHTVPGRETVSGLGMRIVAFSGKDAGRAYSAFLDSLARRSGGAAS